VKGEFPHAGDRQFIARNVVAEAQARELDRYDDHAALVMERLGAALMISMSADVLQARVTEYQNRKEAEERASHQAAVKSPTPSPAGDPQRSAGRPAIQAPAPRPRLLHDRRQGRHPGRVVHRADRLLLRRQGHDQGRVVGDGDLAWAQAINGPDAMHGAVLICPRRSPALGDPLLHQAAIATMRIEEMMAAGMSLKDALEEKRLSAALATTQPILAAYTSLQGRAHTQVLAIHSASMHGNLGTKH
jgi:hypothetical protein